MLVTECRLLQITQNFVIANSHLVEPEDLDRWASVTPELMLRQLPWPTPHELNVLQMATPAVGLEYTGDIREQMARFGLPVKEEAPESDEDGEQSRIQYWQASHYDDETSSNSDIYSPPRSVISIGSSDWVPSDSSEHRWLTASQRAEQDALEADTLDWEFEERSESDLESMVSV